MTYNYDDLENKACIVTGASGLIGSEICNALLALRCKVVAVYNTHKTRIDTLKSLYPNSIFPVELDLTKEDAANSLLATTLDLLGRVDVVVACAGSTLRKSALFTHRDSCEQLMQLNVTSAFQIARLALRSMFRNNCGRIIFIGSRAGEFGLGGQSLYSASKAALHGLAKALAFEVGEKNITVNAIAPGAVFDPHNTVYSEEESNKIVGQIGLKRQGKPEEIASVVCFIASSQASYISGAVIPVDGASHF